MKILTEYRIADCQSPLWQQHTDNIFDKASWLRKLSNHPLLPSKYDELLRKIDIYPLLSAFRLWRRRRHSDVIITGSTIVSQWFALLQLMSPWGRKPHLMIDFMLDDQQPYWWWKLKRSAQATLFRSIDKVILYSENERQQYAADLHMNLSKLQVLHYHTNISKPHLIKENKGYIFSAGSSGRDYATLLEAVKGTGLKLKIVTSPRCLEGIEVPDSVDVFYDIDYMQYLSLLAEAKIVVLTMHDLIRSVGKVVMLEGMSFGKPVIVTKAASVVEYLKHDKNGFLAETYDAAGLQQLLLQLDGDEQLQKRLGTQALEDVHSHWSYDQFITLLLKATKQLCKEKKSSA